MLVHVGCAFEFSAGRPMPSTFQVEPRLDGPFALVSELWTTEPPVANHTYIDAMGNRCRRLTVPDVPWTARYHATVEVSDAPDEADPSTPETPPGELPDDTLMFTLPSRFCQSDLLWGLAMQQFGGLAPGWDRVQAVGDWVHGHITFGYCTSDALTDAVMAYERGTGVCRDFAHLAVSLYRALGIPARYAFGYLPDIGVEAPDAPMDFAAWVEVWLGGRWWTFDPRNNQRRIGRVLIGCGRDAADVAMVTSFGRRELWSMTVWAEQIDAGLKT